MSKNKTVYLSPYNSLTRKLSTSKEFLDKYNFIGFIDKNKTGPNIYTCSNLSQDYNDIIIVSPQYYNDIYNNYIKQNVNSKKITFFITELNIYTRNKVFLKVFYSLYKYSNSINLIKLYLLKNKHKNTRIFLVGNGPSLNIKDLDKLQNEITFAANKIYLSFLQTKWRPTYYIVEDDLVFKQNTKEINNIKNTIKLFPEFSKQWVKNIKNANYFTLKYLPEEKNFPQFHTNPIEGLYWGSTVLYTMIQWAIYFGCKEIYLIGLDFSFEVPKKQILNKDNRVDLICEGEINHFHKEYRKIGEKWNLPNLETQIKSFNKAKEFAIVNGIKIYNASRETKLEVFERVNFDELF